MNRFRAADVRRLACRLVLALLLSAALRPAATAKLVPAAPPPPAEAAAPDRAADMKTVQKTLESKVLRNRLHELGFSDREIDQRLNRLSDKEVHQLASRLHALNPGGDVTVIGLLVAVVLVLLILYLIKRI